MRHKEIVCWFWESVTGSREYTAHHVNLLYNQLRRFVTPPFKLHCITDVPHGLHPDINVIRMPYAVTGYRVNYRKLWVFSSDAAAILPDRFLLLDIDQAIVSNIDDLFERRGNLVMWADSLYDGNWASSTYLHTPGTMTDVWTNFSMEKSPNILRDLSMKVRGRRHTGSDQAWLQYYLPAPYSKGAPGVFESVRDGIYRARLIPGDLPGGARIIAFPGERKPWDKKATKKWPWLVDYRETLGLPS